MPTCFGPLMSADEERLGRETVVALWRALSTVARLTGRRRPERSVSLRSVPIVRCDKTPRHAGFQQDNSLLAPRRALSDMWVRWADYSFDLAPAGAGSAGETTRGFIMEDANTPMPEGDETDAGSRRNLLKIAGAAAGGAAIAAIAANSPKVSATTGQPLATGQAELRANPTYLGNGAGANGGATNPLTTEATMMWVDNRLSVIDGNGLRGDGHGKGTGLWGVNDNGTEGSGVNAFAALGTGVVAQGGLGAVQLVASGPAPATRPAPFIGKLGTLETDTGGNLWFCIGPSSPAALAGKLDQDRRAGFGGCIPSDLAGRRVRQPREHGRNTLGADCSTQSRVIPVGHARNLNGTVATPGVVPAGATAITFNLTVTGTTGAFGT